MPVWIQVFLAIPEILKAFMALVGFIKGQQEKKKLEDLDKLKKEIDDAKSDDDFRNAVGKL